MSDTKIHIDFKYTYYICIVGSDIVRYQMVITRLEELKKYKVKVYLDEEYAFFLYQREINQLKLEEGASITPELYNVILDDIVIQRAKEKALNVLKFMDRSEHEIRTKLAQADFTPFIIDRAITYVKEYGYLNEERFVASYIKARMNRKSKMMIKNELLQKGVEKDIINEIILREYGSEEQEDAELNAIRKAIAKKTRFPEELTFEEKQKLIASLYRKGFDLSKIKRLL